jgi:hypothetical protein
MKRLPELPIEWKAFYTAALMFAGLGVLMGLTYIDFAHRGESGIGISVSDIADLYTGPGASMATLVSLAHIHLLGLFALFTVTGMIFMQSTLSPAWKIVWSVLPFLSFFVDVSGWFLTKWMGIGFVWCVIIGGSGFSLAMAVMILVNLYQMWITPLVAKAR